MGNFDGNGEVLIQSRKRTIKEQGPWFWTSAKALEPVSLPVVWAWARKDLSGALRVLRAPQASADSMMCGRAATDHHGHLARVKSGVACSHVLCCRMRWVKLQKCYPPLKLRVFVDDIKAPLMEKNKEVAEMTKKVMKRLREDEKKGPHEKGKARAR